MPSFSRVGVIESECFCFEHNDAGSLLPSSGKRLSSGSTLHGRTAKQQHSFSNTPPPPALGFFFSFSLILTLASESIKNMCRDAKSHFQRLVWGWIGESERLLFCISEELRSLQALWHALAVEFIFTSYGKNTKINRCVGGHSHAGPGPEPWQHMRNQEQDEWSCWTALM